MKATEILEREHRVIEQVLACLNRLAAESAQSGKLDTLAARDMIDFFRNFADRFHHAKEEIHLFIALENQGMPREGGPTGVMLAEHEMGRELVGKMEKAVLAFENKEPGAVADFAKAAQAYRALLGEHIQKEDHCLFAMSNQSLSEEEQDRLLNAFLAEESKIPKNKGYDFYLKKAGELAERFHVGEGDLGKSASPACGHHGSGSCPGF